MIHYLFVYGTLLKDANNDMSKFLASQSECIGQGYFKGKLYQVSWYPGAIVSDKSSEKVYGSIFKLKDAETVFNVLDEYEGIGEQYPKPHLFKKEQIIAFLEDGSSIEASVYVYNREIKGLNRVESGDFLSTMN
ncbi:hypothetical protein A8C32_01900 [Flavivirga aquatica]|uniref:Gamma-glutamylcyclotransferase AIG2-like domain-containing protein n=1 Tax=Flavivirga aquatica TaxID=1849968 RepID=A0A1E5TA41_9FLAO|nr:gamma-glutamylcyclotransferase family protein [Flavivirga aquatica]OEK08239.1 hypothetical protein A8C32_01900 [Flavivirga aquatica]